MRQKSLSLLFCGDVFLSLKRIKELHEEQAKLKHRILVADREIYDLLKPILMKMFLKTIAKRLIWSIEGLNYLKSTLGHHNPDYDSLQNLIRYTKHNNIILDIEDYQVEIHYSSAFGRFDFTIESTHGDVIDVFNWAVEQNWNVEKPRSLEEFEALHNYHMSNKQKIETAIERIEAILNHGK